MLQDSLIEVCISRDRKSSVTIVATLCNCYSKTKHNELNSFLLTGSMRCDEEEDEVKVKMTPTSPLVTIWEMILVVSSFGFCERQWEKTNLKFHQLANFDDWETKCQSFCAVTQIRSRSGSSCSKAHFFLILSGLTKLLNFFPSIFFWTFVQSLNLHHLETSLNHHLTTEVYV